MKYLISIYIVLFSLHCLAQSNTTELPRTFNEHKNKGVKLGMVKSIFDIEVENDFASDKTNAEQQYGVLIGYQHIPAYDIGFNVQAIYNVFNDEVDSLRIETNVAYGINEMIHVLGGINVHQYLNSYLTDLNSDLGYQVGVGANIQTFNVSLMYYNIENSTDDFFAETSVRLAGVELALGVTF
jgi:hypothetical protein